MDANKLKAIVQRLYQRYPSLRGISPQVREVYIPELGQKRVVLTFRTTTLTENQKPILKWIRATVNEQGKILKISFSK
ncbi:MAG: hypothetical protein RML93_13800 [Anaerolineales bacterium]|nr:hypothetical protein [Anaerolineales bacterium]MCS7247789.1 hypothetical protein [Anaerolineales bacterium]MDW8161599.1 hypothetical protein [Anaerolineales bacterium]MDW8448348.1 hypothetical protein [Anaerolineales bacterium]